MGLDDGAKLTAVPPLRIAVHFVRVGARNLTNAEKPPKWKITATLSEWARKTRAHADTETIRYLAPGFFAVDLDQFDCISANPSKDLSVRVYQVAG